MSPCAASSTRQSRTVAEECEWFWSVHLPRLIAAHRRTPLEHLSGALRFELAGDGGGSWTVRMEQGVLGDVETGGGDVTATVSLTTTDFLRIVRGELHHQLAFFTGKIGVQGDVALLLSLAAFIPVLRERFPFRPRTDGGAA